MEKRSDKKGMELSLNAVVIAILAIVLLVAVVSFFLFGFKGLTDKVKIIFLGTTPGTERTLALQNCASYCEQAALWPESTRRQSPYCEHTFYIDDDGDGEAEKEGEKFIKFKCPKGNKDTGPTRYLNVECTVVDDKENTLFEACQNNNR